MPIASENFDSVIAPALPASWTFDAGLVTSLGTGLIVPTSAPNALALLTISDNVVRFGAYNFPDGVGGDVSLQFNFNADGIMSPQSVGLFARADATTPATYYWLNFQLQDVFAATIDVYKVIASVPTLIGSLLAPIFLVPEWYTAFFALNGSALSVAVSRASDGQYVDTMGYWTPAVGPCISLTDATISGSGYAGVTLQSGNANTYLDDWSLSDFTTCLFPHFDGFDSVTAGSIPACWLFDSPMTTSGGGGEVTPLTLPNTVFLQATSDTTPRLGTYSVIDDNDGDVAISLAFNGGFTSAAQSVGIMGRLDDPVTPANWYDGLFDVFGQTITLRKVVASTPSVLATLTPVVMAVPEWYFGTLALNGTALALSVWRLSDYLYLQPGGTWGSAAQPCLTATDATFGGSGYAGFSIVSQVDATFIDNFDFVPFVVPPVPQTPSQPPANRVREITLSGGSGPVTLLGAVAGYQGFSTVGDGNRTYYAIQDDLAGEWEVGLGTYMATGPSLSRDLVYESSAAGNLVSFGVGPKDVFVPEPAWTVSRTAYALYDHYDTAGSVGTTLTPLYTDTLPGTTFLDLGDKVTARYGLTIVNSASTKAVLLDVAGTTVLDTGALVVLADGFLSVELTLICDSLNSLRYTVQAVGTGLSTNDFANVGFLPSLALSATMDVVLSGRALGGAAANNDVSAVLGSLLRTPRA